MLSEIEKKCLKAWELIYEWTLVNHINLSRCKGRDLYDFFDDNGIIIQITPVWICDKTISTMPHDYKMIKVSEHYVDEWEYAVNMSRCEISFKTRTEAEKGAFRMAFEILEDKLKQN